MIIEHFKKITSLHNVCETITGHPFGLSFIILVMKQVCNIIKPYNIVVKVMFDAFELSWNVCLE
jgi:hypothetical protein